MSGIQYTLRGIPSAVDTALREEAARYGKSLNALVVEKLSAAAGISDTPQTNGLEKFAGTWVEDPAFDEAIKEFEKVDHGEWE